MVINDEHFSNCLVLLGDMISDLQEDEKDVRMLKMLRMTLIEGKKPEPAQPTFCSVHINKTKQK